MFTMTPRARVNFSRTGVYLVLVFVDKGVGVPAMREMCSRIARRLWVGCIFDMIDISLGQLAVGMRVGTQHQ